MKYILPKPDTLGAFASSLCMVHCLATPLLFIAHTCSAGGCASTPIWWKGIDYLFLAISFFAIYRSTRTTSNNFIKPALWISWALLFISILNEQLNWLPLPEAMIYIVAFTLVGLHLYNLKYCQCKTDNCCINHE